MRLQYTALRWTHFILNINKISILYNTQPGISKIRSSYIVQRSTGLDVRKSRRHSSPVIQNLRASCRTLPITSSKPNRQLSVPASGNPDEPGSEILLSGENAVRKKLPNLPASKRGWRGGSWAVEGMVEGPHEVANALTNVVGTRQVSNGQAQGAGCRNWTPALGLFLDPHRPEARKFRALAC